jgi:hypothetical protein
MLHRHLGGQLGPGADDDGPYLVQATTTRAASHLGIFAWQQVAKALAIMLSIAIEDYALGGHVNT